MAFKKDFIWGAASASYQIEGGAFEDGKGLNIWDTFSHQEGRVYNADNGDIACDHYHRFEEDLDIMVQLGIKSYRFSVSWARLIPNGTGDVNEKGIEFYNKLIDGMIKRGIEPCMTLYHWDLPYALHLKGGWLNDESSDWFEEYAKLIAARFGDRVKRFITFNEPQVFLGCGYYEGNHAPGYRLSRPELIRMGHNVLKAHGKACMVLRSVKDAKIGLTGATMPAIPYEEIPEDVNAARDDYFTSDNPGFIFSDAFWFDPAVLGKYPDWVYNCRDLGMPEITDEDLKIINQPLDFIGLNIYRGRYISAEKGLIGEEVGAPHTSIGWTIDERALYWGPKFFSERYSLPIMITENGAACHDRVSLDGCVHDEPRVDYLYRYLSELRRAATDGVDIDGYYVWSILDNFEWAEGYKERFGIVFVDYKTQQRIIKDSGRLYSEIIRTNGENL